MTKEDKKYFIDQYKLNEAEILLVAALHNFESELIKGLVVPFYTNGGHIVQATYKREKRQVTELYVWGTTIKL